MQSSDFIYIAFLFLDIFSASIFLASCSVTIGEPRFLQHFAHLLARQSSRSGSVASIKVYGEAIPPGDLAILTAGLAGLPKAEADVKPDGKIDFGDLAVLGNNWMQDPVLFGDD